MQIKFSYYPEGKRKALTMSYDDGVTQDRRLVSLFNQHGIRGSFHLNSGIFAPHGGRLQAGEVAALYAGHEVSAHGLTHPYLSLVPKEEFAQQILEDRRQLEALCGYPVRGMSYPFGDVPDAMLAVLPALGIEYSRTVTSTGQWALPANFLLWHPTCHHNDRLLERWKEFQNQANWWQMPLLYVWGHSYEFDDDSNWGVMEEFCTAAAHDPNVWYATNIEIVDYVTALKNLKFNVERTMVQNPSALAVWIEVDGEPVKINPGECKAL